MTDTSVRAHHRGGFNWKGVLLERLDFGDTAARSEAFSIASYDTLLLAARANTSTGGASSSWGSGVLGLEFDVFGDGQTWIAVPGSAETVRIQGGTAAAIAATALVELTAAGSVLRIDARGLSSVSVRPTTAAAGQRIDVAMVAYCGEMPSLTYDLVRSAVRAGAESP